ncbi:hypothetical protein FFLO_02729 [Filobasidium floriforme]|uniref:Homeobox domain-containing protein n=1 Tax=Filobasidium floriforme TaxID=5210 RepID=A0A8K0NNV8_9TREE|nr:hypothetical protein FFLO_02729 [Filobasidium floriforme]
MSDTMQEIDKSSPASRTAEWKEILDITKNICRLQVGDTNSALVVNPLVGPNLPTAEECIQSLTTTRRQPLHASFVTVLQARIEQLRQRMLVSYTDSISKMASHTCTERDDVDVQREYSRSIEIWFGQAIEQLFAVLAGKSQVRILTVPDPDILQQAFNVNPTPNDKEREMLATASGYTYKQVTTWFQNHRQRVKSHPGEQQIIAGKTTGRAAARKTGNHAASRHVAAIPKALTRKHRKKTSNDTQSEYLSTLPPMETDAATRVTSRSDGDKRQQESRGPVGGAFTMETTVQHQRAVSGHSSAGSSLFNAVVPPNGEFRPLRRLPGTRKLPSAATNRTSANPALMGPTETNADMTSSAEDASLSSAVTGNCPPSSYERERIPSLTRSVSSASTVSVGEFPQPRDEPLFVHHPRTLPSRGALTAQPKDTQNGRQEDVSFATPVKTAYGERKELLTHAPFQPLAAVQAPMYRHPIPQAQTQNVQQHHTLPSVSTMVPPGASPVQPNLYQMMRDEAGNQFLVQVNSIIPMPVQPSYLPYQQPPYARYDAHEQDLRSASYAVQGIPDENRFEKIETPPPSVQSQAGTRLSSPETSVEQTPSPYLTPEMQVKRTATLATSIVGYTGLEPNIPHGPSQTLASPVEIAIPASHRSQTQALPTAETFINEHFPSEEVQAVPALSVGGVSFSFAELEAGNFVLDEGTLRDMEALLGMEPVDATAPVVDLNGHAADPTQGQAEEKNKKNEGTQTQRQEEYLPNTTGTPGSESSDATVEVVFGQNGSTSHGSYGSATSIAPAQIHTAASTHAATPVYDLNGFNASGKTGQGMPIMGYAPEQDPMPYPPSVPMTQSRSGEPIAPSDIRFSDPQSRVDAPIQVQHQTPAQDQYVYSQPHSQVYSMQEQPQPQPLGGWKYEWEFGVLPFETMPAGEMWTY